ncbi:MAG: ABC transporter ATP-binding protein [Thermoleophilaceae bacterium]|nr:ABC transporter ATP-binding protein [Thermoleophilaceae bacterium]
MTAPLLEVSDLSVRFGGDVDALRGVGFALDREESLAVVGESGAGKSTLAHCIVGLIQPPEAAGSVRLNGEELIGASAATLRSVRWRLVAIALQGAPFNPVVPVIDQVAEPLREHGGLSSSRARRRADDLARESLLDPALLRRFPHQLAGGERRKATLAMALALDPAVVILDEPAAGLDPATGRELLDRVHELRRARGFSLIAISHDLPAVARLCERTIVLYAGEVAEAGPTEHVIGRPAHPYTWALVNSYPVTSTTKDLRPIRGEPPDPRAVPSGCPFHPRCTQSETICRDRHPPLERSGGRLVACHFGGLKVLLSATLVHKAFHSGSRRLDALQAVSLTVREGESVGVVGPSGSGKTTLARVIAGDLSPDRGEVILEGERLARSWRRDARALSRRVQLVRQDPWDALSPRLTVAELVREPLDIAGAGDQQRRSAVRARLESVGLPGYGTFLEARVHELSGGQLQRIALARAIAARPKLLVADEPTSMLDASEQARLLVVLRELQVEMGLGLVLVSHDLALVRKVTDRIVVLDAGRVAEEGSSAAVSGRPRSLAARRLMEAARAFAVGDERGASERASGGGTN